jgi:hypothetical protein
MDGLLLVCVIAIVAAIIAKNALQKLDNREHVTDRASNVGLLGKPPLLLQSAQLLMIEQKLSITDPIYLQARVDEVYQLANKQLIVLDTKSRERARIYLEDRVKLSVYAYILRQMGHVVLGWGYLRIVTPCGTEYKRVPLLSETHLVLLYERARELDGDLRKPTTCDKPALCARCDLRAACERLPQQ